MYVLAMEKCNGDLNEMIPSHGLAYTEFVRVCQFLCTTVKHLRQINLVHRDIKPENILTKTLGDGQIVYKLGDFGAARVLKDNERCQSIYGTEVYMHPDIYAKQYAKALDGIDPNVSFGATHELWSIGATLYCAATGNVPFSPLEGQNKIKMMYQMTTKKKHEHISARELASGEIGWSSQLPDYSLNDAPKSKVEAYLAGLLNVSSKNPHVNHSIY